MTLYVHTNVSLLTAYYPSQCEWEKMVGYSIYGYDLLSLSSKSPEECKQACEDENTFHCQSFDYRRDIEICYLAAASRDEIPLTAHYLHDYYGRNCIGIGVQRIYFGTCIHAVLFQTSLRTAVGLPW